MNHRNYNKLKKLNRNSNDKKSKLCCFGYLDYIVLASSLAIALAEELNDIDVTILAGFFATLSDELALISAVKQCDTNNGDDESDDESIFVPPIPVISSAAMTRTSKKVVKKKKKIKKKV